MVYACALAVVILTSGPAVAFAGQVRNVPSARRVVPGVHVEAMVSDPDGFLWFATERGVVRYDGVDMKLILRNVDVNHAEASALALGPGGRIWVGWRGERGVEYVHGQHLQPINAPSTAHAHAIVSVGEDLWVGSDQGLTRIRGRMVDHNPLAALPAGAVNALAVTSKNALCIGSSDGLFIATLDSNATLQRVGTMKDVVAVAEDSKGRLWVAYGGIHQVHVYTATGDFLFERGATNRQPQAIIRDPHEGVWVATDLGLWHLNQTEEPVSVDFDAGFDPRFRSLAFDVQGHLWAGTVASGALLIDRQPSLRVLGRAAGMSSEFAFSVAQDGFGATWVSTIDSLARLEQDGLFSVLPYESGGLPRDLRSLAKAEDGLWATSHDKGVVLVQQRGKTASIKTFTSRGAWHVHQQDDGRAWFAWSGGGLGFSQSQGPIQDFLLPPGTEVTAMASGSQGALLVGTAAGRIHRVVGNLLEAGDRRVSTTDDARVVSLAELSNGVTCAGTMKGGLDCFAGPRAAHYGAAEGLSNAIVGSILQDDDGQVWLGTTSGILNLHAAPDPSIPVLRTHALGLEAGLLSAECTASLGTSALKLSDGSLLFTTTSGVVWLDPRRATQGSVLQVMVDEFLADGESYPPASATLHLPTNLRHLEIRYTAPRFTKTDKLRFRYQLQGQDTTWVAAGAGRVASYTNLRDGDYRFVVESTDGETSSRAALAFTIPKPFTRTWIFRVAMVAALIFAAFVLRRSRLQQRRARFAIVAEERRRLARDLHDTVEQSILSVRLQLDSAMVRLGRNSVRSRSALGHIDRAVELLTMASGGMRTAIHALRFQGTRQGLAVDLRTEAARLLRHTDVEFNLHVKAELPTLPLDVEHQLVAIAKEALTNAVKNGMAHKVEVTLDVDGSELRMLVADNGTGFDHTAPVRTGHFGLVGMRERAEKLGARLALESGPGQGTTVSVVLPDCWRS